AGSLVGALDALGNEARIADRRALRPGSQARLEHVHAPSGLRKIAVAVGEIEKLPVVGVFAALRAQELERRARLVLQQNRRAWLERQVMLAGSLEQSPVDIEAVELRDA